VGDATTVAYNIVMAWIANSLKDAAWSTSSRPDQRSGYLP
jgi:hypothetical protein